METQKAQTYVQNNPGRWVDPEGLAPGDKLHGLPKAFWKWYHTQVKRKGDPDISEEDAKKYYEEWKDKKPGPDNKGKRKPKRIPKWPKGGGLLGGPMLIFINPCAIDPNFSGCSQTCPGI